MVSALRVVDSLEALREGSFQDALRLADDVIQKDPKDFWAWFAGACALAFLHNRQSFDHYFRKMHELDPQSPYTRYLAGYAALLDKDVERALWEWTRLIDEPEGWLALDLIEKARKQKAIFENVQSGQVAEFILIPDFSKELHQVVPLEEDEEPSKEDSLDSDMRHKPGPSFPKLWPVVLLSTLGLGTLVFAVQRFLPTETIQLKNVPDIEIQDSAHLLSSSVEARYTFPTKDALIQDFNAAREHLKEGRLNQSLFLLRRILASNADFQTKEKARIFLKFIPQPNYNDFEDNVSIEKILETPEFYSNAYIIWQVNVLTSTETSKGFAYNFEVEGEKGNLHKVDAFFTTENNSFRIKDLEDWQKKSSTQKTTQKKAIVFAQFKGIVGEGKAPYLEIIKIWI